MKSRTLVAVFVSPWAHVNLPVHPWIFAGSCALKSPKTIRQSFRFACLQIASSSVRVSCWEGCTRLLCGTYTATTRRLQMGPFSLTQHILSLPLLPLAITLLWARVDRMMPTPAAASCLFMRLPCLSLFVALAINSLDRVVNLSWFLHNSVTASTSYPSSLQ